MQGNPWRAARLYGCASVIVDTTVAYPFQARRPDQETHIAAIRAALDDELFAEAWAQGRAMTLDEAVTYALAQEPAAELASTAPTGDPWT